MKPGAPARTRARQFLVQALYQAQLTDTAFGDLAESFVSEHNMKRADVDYFQELLAGIGRDRARLTALVSKWADRDFAELDPVETGILLLGCYELWRRPDVPCRVVINESVALARSFGATGSYKYVNAILDAIAKELRG